MAPAFRSVFKIVLSLLSIGIVMEFFTHVKVSKALQQRNDKNPVDKKLLHLLVEIEMNDVIN